MKNILTKAILVKLSISQFNPKRADEKITREVLDNHGSKREAGLWMKNILDPKTLANISKAAVETRAVHYRMSLPWQDDGLRILPTAMYAQYQDAIRKCKQVFDAEVESFIRQYPSYVADARTALNGMFNDADYPTIMEVRSKFGIEFDFRPLPCGSDFRVSIDKDELKSMAEDVNKRVEEAVQDAMKDLWTRLAQPLKHMVEKLKDPKAIFRDTLVENIREVVEVIPALNVADDSDLANIVKECKETVLKHTADDLRDGKKIRENVRTQAEALLKKMEGYI